MTKFESLAKALEITHKIKSKINTLIKEDLYEAGCENISLDAWMQHCKTKDGMLLKYHQLCELEMDLINAQLVVEHHKSEETRLGV